MSKEFLALVLVSSLISIPIAHYVLSSWLQNYEYRTELQWWVFGIAVFAALIITLITVSYHAVLAAMKNPVDSLKSE
jgi:ABC-type antimicrobial peptide transport system permease subunit